MSVKIQLQQFTKLNELYCQNIEINYKGSLNQVVHKLNPIMAELNDKVLCHSFLIPNSQKIQQGKFKYVALGGTFDYLHIGHQILLLTAILSAKQKLFVGVTGLNMLKNKKNKQVIQSVQIRKMLVEKYIKKIKPQLKIQIQQINDPFGPAITDQSFEAIAVSLQTKAGAEKINQIRKQKNMKQLEVIICPLVNLSEESPLKISSTNTRQWVLQKNQFKIDQFIKYKENWYILCSKLSKLLKIQVPNLYIQVWWNELLLKYSQYWRFYHTNKHISFMLNSYNTNYIKQLPHLNQFQQIILYLAIWFHDIEYLPSSKTNQQQSADKVSKFLQGLAKQSSKETLMLIQRTRESIMATKTHKSLNLQSKILIDLDMLLLDSSNEQYEKYAKQIRKQYQPLVKDQYNKKRIQFLKTLNPNQIFYFHKPTRVDKNIKWQIEYLGQGLIKQQL